MEDDPEGEAAPRAHATHAVPEVDAVGAPRPLDRAVADREDHAVAPPQRYDFRPRLHARPLLGENEFAAAEVDAGLLQQNRHLEREDVFAVHVLVQAVEIAGNILEQEGSRPDLAGRVAPLEESGVLG